MTTSVELVLPVLNEETDLDPSTREMTEYLSEKAADYECRVVIADNGSTDSTPDVAKALSDELSNVEYLRIEERGRGRAVSQAWLASDADVLVYMDIDLSTELGALSPLLDAVASGGYDMAIASRLKKGARVIGRPPHREVISRIYSWLVRMSFWTGIQDFQCGFKAIGHEAARDLLPLVEDTGWFFDSELLLLAAKNGYRISEIPVEWRDSPDSRVRIVSTAVDDLKGLARLRFGGLGKAKAELARRR